MHHHRQPTLFLLHGYIGCGKTTLARQLEKYHQAVRFSPDDWMVALYGQDPPEESFQKNLQAIKKLMEDCWLRLVNVGVNVVLDYGFWTRLERDSVRDLAKKEGFHTVLFSLECSEEKALQRARKRNETGPGQLYIADNTYEVLKDRFEPLEDEEDRITVFMW